PLSQPEGRRGRHGRRGPRRQRRRPRGGAHRLGGAALAGHRRVGRPCGPRRCWGAGGRLFAGALGCAGAAGAGLGRERAVHVRGGRGLPGGGPRRRGADHARGLLREVPGLEGRAHRLGLRGGHPHGAAGQPAVLLLAQDRHLEAAQEARRQGVHAEGAADGRARVQRRHVGLGAPPAASVLAPAGQQTGASFSSGACVAFSRLGKRCASPSAPAPRAPPPRVCPPPTPAPAPPPLCQSLAAPDAPALPCGVQRGARSRSHRSACAGYRHTSGPRK
ncbi:unnamed protein product, partial [Prorocentrum cordatum]